MTNTDMEDNAVALHGAPLQLPVLPAAQIAAMPVDETVSRRLLELNFDSRKVSGGRGEGRVEH